MKFNKFIFLPVIGILLFLGLIFLNSSNNYIKTEELILKYSDKIAQNDAEAIKQSIMSNSYANVIIELDDNNNIDEILTSLYPFEFEQKESSMYFVGKASLTGIEKLLQNQHVIRIYYNFHVSG